MIYSFDIFDTCLVRKCGSAHNMVDVLSTLIFVDEIDEWKRQNFVVERIAAERTVSKNNPNGTLDDIYKLIDTNDDALKSKDAIMQIELDLEDKMLLPVCSIKSEIDILRERGNRILFISDMYLSKSFIEKKLREVGLLCDGDGLFVSNEISKTKFDGNLYDYILNKEQINPSKWVHTGDNYHSDYVQARRYGIKSQHRVLRYNPYPQRWLSNDYTIAGGRYGKILAGLSRASKYSNPSSSHADIVFDVIAPLYSSWVYQVLRDARDNNISRLCFCARDAYIIHKVALQYKHLFPDIEIQYIYMSRNSIYNETNTTEKLAYFLQTGLATKNEKVALVDITSSGKMLQRINDFLVNEGYLPVHQYIFSLWHQPSKWRDYYRVLNFDPYVTLNFESISLQSYNWMIYESYFAVNEEKKTHDYAFVEGVSKPVFKTIIEKDECQLRDAGENYKKKHEEMIVGYTKDFIQTGLYKHSDEILRNICIRDLNDLFSIACPTYLESFEKYYVSWGLHKTFVPYVKKSNLLVLLFNKITRKDDHHWFRGSLAVSSPKWVLRLINIVKPNSFYI